jgi:anhydro-N-acetylmuramic acid kinase
MSGTSMDGIDAALLDLEDGDDSDDGEAGEGGGDPRGTLEGFVTVEYGAVRREALRDAVDRGDAPALCRLHACLGEWLAEAVHALLAATGVNAAAVDVIGCHGHTVWHSPPTEGRRGETLQLGDPATLAARTRIPVVSDFRSADVAAGGHGAPLVPWPDRVLLSVPGRRRALQNLGGIGNVTWLPPRGAPEPPVAFDTGPGNVLMDLAARRASAGRLDCDRDGVLAARGRVDEGLLARLMGHPFLSLEPPRSTGREAFGPALVDGLASERGLEDGAGEEEWADLLATLSAFTARTVAGACRRWILPLGLDEMVVTGGGARNPELVRRIRQEMEPVPVGTGAEALGMDPDAREAAAMAVLAWAHVRGVPGNVPSVTGAERAVVLGALTPAP